MSPSDYRVGAGLERELRRIRARLLVFGILLLGASVAGAFFSANDFFRGYLIGYLYCLALTLGCMGLLMVQYLTGGAWGIVCRRTLEAASRNMPLMVILFIPLIFGLGNLYQWARPELVAQDHLLRHRQGYMNPAFFDGRAAFYLIVWFGLAWLLNRWSLEQDQNPQAASGRAARISAAGLILYLFSISFAAVDWVESLETRWASTMWGLMFIGAQGLVALAFIIVVLALLYRYEPMSGLLKPDHFVDLGKMMFAALMVWAYFAFCQYLIVWSENLVSEIHYYLPRTGTSWGWLATALIVVEFIIPMLLLLSRPLKRHPGLLAGVAAVILTMHYFHLIWIVLPAYYKEGFRIQWMQVLAPIGLISIWLWGFLRELPRGPLVPVNAPELEIALSHVAS